VCRALDPQPYRCLSFDSPSLPHLIAALECFHRIAQDKGASVINLRPNGGRRTNARLKRERPVAWGRPAFLVELANSKTCGCVGRGFDMRLGDRWRAWKLWVCG
jgi:hypothetical protein